MSFLNKIPVLGLLSLSLLTAGAKAESVTIQYFLGGVEGTPENCVGVLVADANSDGFNSVFQPGIVGDQLVVGETLAGSDDVVIGITESTGDDFDGAEVGFADTFSLINYQSLGIAAGTPVRFFWFPTQDASSAGALAADVGFLSYTDNAPDTGGNMAYTLPPAPGVYTLSHLTAANSGSRAQLTSTSGSLGPIETQPVGGTFAADEVVTLTVATRGTSPFDYQWYEGSTGDTSSPLGENSATLEVDALVYNSKYWVRVSDSSGHVDSVAATVLVEGGGLRPEFTWSAVDGAEWYNLYIAKDGALLRNFWLEGDNITSWTSETNLYAGRYTWWVRTWSASGGYTAWAQQDPFSIALPELLTPEGRLAEGNWRPLFSWTRSLGATWYQLHINRNGAVWRAFWLQGEDVLSWTPDAEMPAGSYQFWVRPYSVEGGYGPWSNPMDFSIALPELLAPDGDQGKNTFFPEFTWNGSSKTDQYNLYISRNGTLWENFWIVGPAESWTPSNEFGSGDYIWWMRGWSAAEGYTPWSESKQFQIQEGVPLAPLGLTNGSARPLFEWEEEAGVTWHNLWVGTTSGTVVYNSWLQETTSWQPENDLQDGSYVWWLRPYGPRVGYGAWRGPFAFELDNSGSGGSAPAPMESSGPIMTSSDLNGDGMGDLLAQNFLTGDVRFQLLENDALIGEVSPSIQPGDPDWKVVGHGDYDGDRDADLLWQNATTGDAVVWVLGSGGNVDGVESLDLSGFGNSVLVEALADFNGDGSGDLLVRDSVSGDLNIAILDEGVIVQLIGFTGSKSLDWNVVAVADMNVDDSYDIVWQNTTTGHVEYSYLDSENPGVVSSELAVSGASTAGLTVVAAFDINGDEQIDLILEDGSTGTLSSALIDGGSIYSVSDLTYQLPTADWRVVNFGE